MPRRHRIKRMHAGKSGLAASASTLCFLAIAPTAHAGSISANTATYAGDVGGLNFPVGTVAVTNYTAYRNGGTFYDSNGTADKTGNLDTITNVARFDWIVTKIYDMPLVLSASLPYGYVENATVDDQ